MAQKDYTSVSIRNETKQKIDEIAEEEEMTITGVVDSSIGFVFAEFYDEPRGSDPMVRPHDDRRPDIDTDKDNMEIEL
jgi:hypothetical protein